MIVDAGKLNRRITIQQRVQTKDADGGIVDAWSDFAENIWSNVIYLDSVERKATNAGGIKLEAKTRFIIRYLSGITNTMRVSFNSQHYNIRHINDFDDKHAYMIISCDLGGADGR